VTDVRAPVAGPAAAPLAAAPPSTRAGVTDALVPAPRVPPAFGRPGARLARRLGRRVRHGTLEFTDPDGTWRAGQGQPVVQVQVHDRRAYAAFMLRGSEGLGESYMAGWWDASDLTTVVRLILRNLAGPIDVLDRVGQAASGPLDLVERLWPPSPASDRRNVQAHYDLTGDVFAVMLDETMSYSCAVFEDPAMDLAAAQRAKLDRLCTKLDLGPDDHLVEIGTGWGGLALHAASRYGCRVTTTTISDAQRQVALERVGRAGLGDRVEVLDVDYRELTGTYDKLVSVEMIEAVDWRRHDAFFATCGRLLKPDGLMALQAITIADRSYERAKRHDDFIRRLIFPGGCLPSVSALCRSATRSSELRLVDLEDIGRHYATTLARWRVNFEAGWETVAAAGFDPSFRRLWNLYLSYCEGAFLERHISDVQAVFAGPAWRGTLAPRRL